MKTLDLKLLSVEDAVVVVLQDVRTAVQVHVTIAQEIVRVDALGDALEIVKEHVLDALEVVEVDALERVVVLVLDVLEHAKAIVKKHVLMDVQ